MPDGLIGGAGVARSTFGVVRLDIAVQDKAPRAEEEGCGDLDKRGANTKFWCTLCQKVVSRSTAGRCRVRHPEDFQRRYGDDAEHELARQLTELYGASFIIHALPIVLYTMHHARVSVAAGSELWRTVTYNALSGKGRGDVIYRGV